MRRVVLTLLALSAAVAPAQPRVPLLTLSGELQDSAGNPLSGAVDLTVRLYSNRADPVGQAFHLETFSLSGITRGRFAVKLGSSVALDGGSLDVVATPAGAGIWVGMQVGAEAEMSPRVQLTSVPWALSTDWTGLTSKPATFPPAAHTHGGAEVTSAVPSANAVPWTGVTGRPSSFTPSVHAHPMSELTGVLPMASGGTGSATQNFVDLTAPQTIAGDKSFTGVTTLGNAGAFQPGPVVTIQTSAGWGAGRQALLIRNAADNTTTGITTSLAVTDSAVYASLSAVGQNYTGVPGTAGFALIDGSMAGVMLRAADPAGSIRFVSGGSTATTAANLRMTIDPAGNVGIGTATPQAQLDVAGLMRLSKVAVGALPACTTTIDGSIALTTSYVLCACKVSAWVKVSDGTSACN